jgi:uncharacterized membrane protein
VGFVLAIALGVAAGLNPYVTVAIMAVVAWRSSLLTTSPGFEFIGTLTVVVIALALLPVDLFADKFPGSGRHIDRIGWLLRPAAGGLVGGAVVGTAGPAVAVGVVLGAIMALLTHALRLRVRDRVQGRLLGFGRIVFGAYGDLTSGLVALLALLLPPLGLAVAVLVLGSALLVERRWGGLEPA